MVESERVLVRPFTLSDIDEYRAWYRPELPWAALDGPYYPFMDPDERIGHLTRWIEAGNEPDPFRLHVVADRGTDRLIGTVNRYWISKETHWPAIGIVLFDDSRWGQGLGFEALSQWVDLLFRVHPEIVRLDMRTWSGNHGMMRLAEKLGFQLEARFRKARIVKGEYYDGLGYGLLRDEWPGR